MSSTVEKIGTSIRGKYKLESLIDTGGMGTVFLATHLALGKKVAVKMLHRSMTTNSGMVVRFLNEAIGTSRVSHRNIVDILDIGIDEGGLPFFVMEYLQGESLKQRLARKEERLPLEETVDIMIQVLAGLQTAHAKGITHRDLKPGNIFIAREGGGTEIVKILDFGLARFQELEAEGKAVRTDAGVALGTPDYMSPEQLRGIRDEIDYRTDIYSCGIILYRCLTGMSPFHRQSQRDTILSVLQAEALAPSFLLSTIPKEVDRIILKAMDKDRTLRYQDCATFSDAIEAFRKGGATARRAGGPGAKRSAIRRLLLPLVGGAALALAVWCGWLVYSMTVGRGASEQGAGGAPNAQGKPADPDVVTIEFLGLPAGAKILVDGKPAPENPVRLPRSDRPILFVVSSAGREIFNKTIVPTANEKITIVQLQEDNGRSSKKVKNK